LVERQRRYRPTGEADDTEATAWAGRPQGRLAEAPTDRIDYDVDPTARELARPGLEILDLVVDRRFRAHCFGSRQLLPCRGRRHDASAERDRDVYGRLADPPAGAEHEDPFAGSDPDPAG